MIVHYLMRSGPMNVTQVSFHLFRCICALHFMYLVRVKNLILWCFSQALKIFSDARPPGIYKPDYIDALYTFYHEIKPESVICPSTPEWKRSTELDLNGEAVPDDDDDDGGPAGPVQVISVLTNDRLFS